MSDSPTRLAIESLSKTFASSRVLTDITFSVSAGEIHGLVGQNGSGKSTLIKILTGVYAPDPGAKYTVDGKPMHLPARWRQVHDAGVSVVHQDLGLIDRLTIAENVCVGGFPTHGLPPRIDGRRRDERTRETLARLGLEVSPRALVGSLPAADRAGVAIARAMRDHTPGNGVIILDESTRALSGDPLSRMHEMMARIAAEGTALVLVSHSIGEVLAVTDCVTVLRDGRAVGNGVATRGMSEQSIAKLMLGSTVSAVTSRSQPVSVEKNTVFRVSNLAVAGLDPVDLQVNAGEIVGITGMPGGGYERIPYLVTGAEQAGSGDLVVGGKAIDCSRSSVMTFMRAGIALVPERRDRDGLALEMTVRDNIALPSLSRNGKPWFVRRAWQQQTALSVGGKFDLRPNQPSILVKQLSGGNQQKVLLAKWLSTGPRVLVLHEPTQAVDIGARRDILQTLQGAAESGMAVLLVSGEPEDLMTVCDRILIYRASAGLVESDAGTPEALIDEIYTPSSEQVTHQI